MSALLASVVGAGQGEGVLRTSSLLMGCGSLGHGFSTRQGPPGLVGALDLGPAATEQTWTWVANQAGLPGGMPARLSQVHGAVVHSVTNPQVAGEGDAMVTGKPGLMLSIRVADCVPVLLARVDAQDRAVQVAAAHAGWRGLAAQVIGATVAAMQRDWERDWQRDWQRDWEGAETRLVAAVGPCISVDKYEVDAPVAAGLRAVIPATVCLIPGRPGHWQADLKAAARWQLEQAGVAAIDVLPDCTASDPMLHSYRRDGPGGGRLAAVIGLLP